MVNARGSVLCYLCDKEIAFDDGVFRHRKLVHGRCNSDFEWSLTAPTIDFDMDEWMNDSEYLINLSRLRGIAWANKWPCYLCGEPFQSKDDISARHIVRRSAGGGHDTDNLAPVHERCSDG